MVKIKSCLNKKSKYVKIIHKITRKTFQKNIIKLSFIGTLMPTFFKSRCHLARSTNYDRVTIMIIGSKNSILKLEILSEMADMSIIKKIA